MLIAAPLAALTGLISVAFAYLNHRARINAKARSELPQLFIYGRSTDYHFRLETDHSSIGWKVIRVEALDADHGECLAQETVKINGNLRTYNRSEWRAFCDYPEGASSGFTPIFFHPNCYRASLSFICEIPSRMWWKPWQRQKKRLPYIYKREEIPSIVKDPLLTEMTPDRYR